MTVKLKLYNCMKLGGCTLHLPVEVSVSDLDPVFLKAQVWISTILKLKMKDSDPTKLSSDPKFW